MTTIYGIRHHGPGSARSLLNALHEQQPDCILIEGPPDADALIAQVADTGLQPPVALLIYNPKQLQAAAYYPFAAFSPEWIAMQYAVQNGVNVQFMDLPQAFQLGATGEQQQLFEPQETTDKTDTVSRRDPLAYLAKLAGYTDSERWWDITFERGAQPAEIFPAIIELMRALRDRITTPDTLHEQQREAYMRQTIRAAEKSGFTNIAVICGAWHSPALADTVLRKAKDDTALLKGLKKIPVEATWVAWTYGRIASGSGYGAGVVSPHWYGMLFDAPEAASTAWLTAAAHLLRQADMAASTANTIEAIRLADTLATLRQLPIAGIEELREAVVTCFADGNLKILQLIDKQLIVGERLGNVPAYMAMLPFQQDLEKTIQKLKLSRSPERKPITEKGFIDLRKERDRNVSYLLWRLRLLQLNWGLPQAANRRNKGSFHEYWELEWQPDFAIRVIEAGTWGNTVVSAAAQFVQVHIRQTQQLTDLTAILEMVLKADLPSALPELLMQLRHRAALTYDISILMDALLPMANVLRYGDARQTDAEMISAVIDELLPRIAAGLPTACYVDNDAAEILFKKILATNRAIHILHNANHQTAWTEALIQAQSRAATHPLLNGTVVRLLFDDKTWQPVRVAQAMQYAMSVAEDPARAVAWLEGFTHGSGQLLVYQTELFAILDAWVSGLEADVFDSLLPLMRRAFAHFSIPERGKILQLANPNYQNKKNNTAFANDKPALNMALLAELLPNLQLILGR